jgi:hypothetical protein
MNIEDDSSKRSIHRNRKVVEEFEIHQKGDKSSVGLGRIEEFRNKVQGPKFVVVLHVISQ